MKYLMEDAVKQNFTEPLLHMQNKDLKEVNVSGVIWVEQFGWGGLGGVV